MGFEKCSNCGEILQITERHGIEQCAWCGFPASKPHNFLTTGDLMGDKDFEEKWEETSNDIKKMASDSLKGEFEVKDSGVRMEYESGMHRDTQEGKVDYDLIPSWFLKRFAEHLTKGAKKYGENNWQLANSEAELKRFYKSAIRHYMQWRNGETDEDHMAAVCFNLMAAEHVKSMISKENKDKDFVFVACANCGNKSKYTKFFLTNNEFFLTQNLLKCLYCGHNINMKQPKE